MKSGKAIKTKTQDFDKVGEVKRKRVEEVDLDALTLDQLRHFYNEQSKWTKEKLREHIRQVYNATAILPQYLSKIQLVDILTCYMRDEDIPVFKRERVRKNQPEEEEKEEERNKKEPLANKKKLRAQPGGAQPEEQPEEQHEEQPEEQCEEPPKTKIRKTPTTLSQTQTTHQEEMHNEDSDGKYLHLHLPMSVAFGS